MPSSHERELAEARAEFPEWDIREVFGGWLAVPVGTPVIQGMYLDSIREKLREL